MTKIKNTKKGMAKKTLSMSLVVAMLATSNVPVWAAEFSDGSDSVVETTAPAAETFSDETSASASEETETPVVTDEAEVSATATVVESNDLKINVSVSESATFAKDAVKVSGTILKKDGTALNNFKYGWRVAGQDTNIYTREITDGDVTKMGFRPDFKTSGDVDWDQYVGQKLELYIFNNGTEADETKINPVKIGSTIINKLDMSDAQLALETYNGTDVVTYNGKEYYFGDTAKGNSVTLASTALTNAPDVAPGNGQWTKENVLKYFDISASGTAKNAGDVLTVTATAKKDSPYTGTAKDVTIRVCQKDFDDALKAGQITVESAAGLSYQYTGDQIKVPNDKITLKETSALSGADLSAAVGSAYTEDAGNPSKGFTEQKVKVYLDATKLPNFSNVPKSILASKNTVTVKKRDLASDCVISLGEIWGTTVIPLDKIPTGTYVDDLSDYLVFKDKEGNLLNLNDGFDYTVTVKKNGVQVTNALESVGTYELTVSATSTDGVTFDGNCINSQTFKVIVSDNAMYAYGYSANNYESYYTGSEVKPSQADLGAVVIPNSDYTPEHPLASDAYKIVGYKNNVNARSTTALEKAPAVTIEITEGKYKGNKVDVLFDIKPLNVKPEYITVPETISYNKGYKNAKEYNVPVKVVAKDPSGKIVKELTDSDYTVSYKYVDGTNKPVNNTIAQNELHDKIRSTITIKNANFVGNGTEVTAAKDSEIVAKSLTDSMLTIAPATYTYTGGNIVPELLVKDGAYVLYEGKENDGKGEYEVTSITNNLNVGTGKVTIKGINDLYSGTASATFTITAANTSDVKVEIAKEQYTGKAIRPRKFKATLNGNDVTDQFEIVDYGENVNAGKGTVVLKPVDGNKNFTGGNITAEFDIYKEAVAGTIAVYDANGENVTSKYATDGKTLKTNQQSFTFDGNEQIFATEKLTLTTKDTTAKASDFEIKYAENVTGIPSSLKSGNDKYNIAYVYAVAKEGSGFTGNDEIVLADGTTIKNVVAKTAFLIKNVYFNAQNVSVKNATYAGGLPVKPEVLVQIKGRTLVEGKDYKLTLSGASVGENYTDVTDGKVYGVTVTGIGGYVGSEVKLVKPASWGIDKKDIKDCDVKAIDGVITVMNGYIPVPTTEYTSKNNGDGTYTVTANSASKNYTGSKTVTAQGKAENEKPDAPMISSVKVVGNKATAILSGDSEGAAGYDYVISTDRDCITNKDYDSVNKNQVQTSTTFKYVQQGTYYAYCHAWKRDENGKKVFSDWSNAYPFVVSAITPDAPVITNVKVSGSTIKVTYKAAANATGYDVVLGTDSKKENGETRPYHYGNHKVLNLKEGTVTATFKNVPKGTWVVGMHAFNRTSEDGKKVFSPWSNLKKATVK